jgi:hypothetical protein
MGIDASTYRRLLALSGLPIAFVSLQRRSFFATKRLRGSFLTNEKRMNENLVEARSTPWTRPNN